MHIVHKTLRAYKIIFSQQRDDILIYSSDINVVNTVCTQYLRIFDLGENQLSYRITYIIINVCETFNLRSSLCVKCTFTSQRSFSNYHEKKRQFHQVILTEGRQTSQTPTPPWVRRRGRLAAGKIRPSRARVVACLPRRVSPTRARATSRDYYYIKC